ncbi:MAG: hypothetical protein J1E81_06275 [Eubacterium sp.]|nr:hypothetical protein [Eubacterium sp.]
MKFIYSQSENIFEISQFIATTEEHKAIALANGYVEVSDEDYERLVNHELCWNNGELVPYYKTQEEITEEQMFLRVQETEMRIAELKAELAKIKEDIEQEAFGIVRDDYTEKKVRAAEIINELRVLEGKEPRVIKF